MTIYNKRARLEGLTTKANPSAQERLHATIVKATGNSVDYRTNGLGRRAQCAEEKWGGERRAETMQKKRRVVACRGVVSLNKSPPRENQQEKGNQNVEGGRNQKRR